MILYTYSSGVPDLASRWRDTGSRDEFFDCLETVSETVRELRDEITRSDPGMPWTPIHIERVEIGPIDEVSRLMLLNEGIGPLVQSYEVVGTID